MNTTTIYYNTPALSNGYIKRKRLFLSITCQVTALKKVGYASIYLNSLYTSKTSPSETRYTIFRLNKPPYLKRGSLCVVLFFIPDRMNEANKGRHIQYHHPVDNHKPRTLDEKKMKVM